MSQILFADFLTNPVRYQELESFWTELFDRLIAEKGWSWRPWMKPAFADGAPFLDGNPIFNAYVPELNKGVRILQTDPEDSDEFSYYEDEVELEDGTVFSELVISLILTEETKERVADLLGEWLNE